MNTSAVLLTGSVIKDSHRISSFHGVITGASDNTITISNNGHEITVNLDQKGDLRKGESVILLHFGDKLIIQKLSSDSQQTANADSLHRQKILSSEDLRALLVFLSESSQKKVSTLASEALQKLGESVQPLSSTLFMSAEKLLSCLEKSVTKSGDDTLLLEKTLRSELIALNTVLRSRAGANPIAFELPADSSKKGFFAFPSLQSCRCWLSENGVRDHPAGILEHVVADDPKTPIYVRVMGNEKSHKAVVLSPSQLHAETRELLSNMKSTLLRQSHPEMLQHILFDRSSLSEQHLKELDDKLFRLDKESSAPALSPESLKRSFIQVLHQLKTRVSSNTIPPDSAVYALSPSACNLLKDLLVLRRYGLIDSILPDIPAITPGQVNSESTSSLGEFLNQYMDRLGITLESKLAAHATPLEQPKSSDLKSILLQLSDLLEQVNSPKQRREGENVRNEVVNTNQAGLSAIVENMAAHEMHDLRQLSDKMMNRIEALQFLARPVATAEGEQQVIAVPMRIDGEWTEVRLQVLRKKGASSRKGKKKQYSLNVSVSPRVLGEVSATIYWEESKHCQISIGFEKQSTYNWFDRRKESFRHALQSRGLPVLRLDMHSLEPAPQQSIDSHFSSHNGILDIQG